MPDKPQPTHQHQKQPLPENPLSYRQVQVLQALILNPSIKDAAAAAKVGESTIYRWLAQEGDFKTLYRQTCRKLLDQAINLLYMHTSHAVNTLHEISQDKQAPYNSRIAASCALIGLSIKGMPIFAAEERRIQLMAELRDLGPDRFPFKTDRQEV